MGTSEIGRYINTKGSGHTPSDYAVIHSNEGTYNRPSGKGSRLRLVSGGHGEAGLKQLRKYGIKYNIVKTFANGVRVGVIRTHGKIATIFPDTDQSSVLKPRRKK